MLKMSSQIFQNLPVSPHASRQHPLSSLAANPQLSLASQDRLPQLSVSVIEVLTKTPKATCTTVKISCKLKSMDPI